MCQAHSVAQRDANRVRWVRDWACRAGGMDNDGECLTCCARYERWVQACERLCEQACRQSSHTSEVISIDNDAILVINRGLATLHTSPAVHFTCHERRHVTRPARTTGSEAAVLFQRRRLWCASIVGHNHHADLWPAAGCADWPGVTVVAAAPAGVCAALVSLVGCVRGPGHLGPADAQPRQRFSSGTPWRAESMCARSRRTS
jgi:hypothetical protein